MNNDNAEYLADIIEAAIRQGYIHNRLYRRIGHEQAAKMATDAVEAIFHNVSLNVTCDLYREESNGNVLIDTTKQALHDIVTVENAPKCASCCTIVEDGAYLCDDCARYEASKSA